MLDSEQGPERPISIGGVSSDKQAAISKWTNCEGSQVGSAPHHYAETHIIVYIPSFHSNITMAAQKASPSKTAGSPLKNSSSPLKKKVVTVKKEKKPRMSASDKGVSDNLDLGTSTDNSCSWTPVPRWTHQALHGQSE